MKILVTGANGFIGKNLIKRLGYIEGAQVCPFDIDTDPAKLAEYADKADIVYHLAAQSSVAVSWKRPQLTAEINVIGTINVLEALREYGRSVRTLLVGSGEEYGFIREGACPLSEEEPLRPGNIYAATKACQGMIGEIYSRAYKMDIVMVRAFNHSGPGQADMFVISDFCKQIAEAEKGLREPSMKVGNLSAKRDFTDVRDVVRAYRLLGTNGVSGRTYNVGRGRAVDIQYILDTALKMSAVPIEVTKDPARLRASDIPLIEPDVSLIMNDTGWKAEITIEQTVADTLGYWRGKL